LELTLSEGLISGIRSFNDGPAIQTSAAISHGSSGGGLFDEYGQLVGITTSFLAEGQSLNFALPAEWILDVDKYPGTPVYSAITGTYSGTIYNLTAKTPAKLTYNSGQRGEGDD
jgi:S1-C subfamily serine protease